ncbi:hypothetical protein CYMTET_51302 [Cymbomonas tetramitiformis]|uniref:Right handed beta helix domain-containing protein n=1 Tax=Cymbomonas tetramitiformis TaxID=36881 RepID=A0AAE0ERY9_9CHLO|nr:hypothetical protein CYMTET_51302 [Cymbomonas tetramitiformis]
MGDDPYDWPYSAELDEYGCESEDDEHVDDGDDGEYRGRSAPASAAQKAADVLIVKELSVVYDGEQGEEFYDMGLKSEMVKKSLKVANVKLSQIEEVFAMERCRALVIVNPYECSPRWKRCIPHIQNFVAAGGVVAICGAEALAALPMIREAFQKDWGEWGCYGRKTFTKSSAAVNTVLAGGVDSFSAKATCMKGESVPESERMYITDEEAKVDVAVALGKYGEGQVAYFADVNCEKATAKLVAELCEAGQSSGGLEESVEVIKVRSMAELQHAFESCVDGSTIELAAGKYECRNGVMTIPPKALILKGSGSKANTSDQTKMSILKATVKTTPNAKGEFLGMSSIQVDGGFDIEDNDYQKLIFGGGDGLMHSSHETKLHLKDCEIRWAESRGIFANSSFVIEDTEISNCGSYGIKCRGGCEVKGGCDIQSGPWDSLVTLVE